MSTRANILIKAGEESLWFYRHSDGYPEGTMPTLSKFMEWLKAGRIRDNLGQAAGWLIVLGHLEYRDGSTDSPQFEPGSPNSGMGWKVGAYEPTTGQHGDIEWLYTIDLVKKTLKKQHLI